MHAFAIRIHLAVDKIEEMTEVVIVSVTLAVVCIVVITVIIVSTAILYFVFTGKKQQKCDNTEQNDGPLATSDEEKQMFEQNGALGCQRFVPTMVELYENMASGEVKPEDTLDDQAENVTVMTRID